MEALNVRPSCKIGIAVSGGPDSLCLLLLAHQWAKAEGGKVIALHVNHGLRHTAQIEAQELQKFCQKRDIPCHILAWEHEEITTGIQQRARNARYELLLKKCESLGLLYLLTAHHQNDQLETIHMRTLRKSGPRGLAGIQAITWTPFAKILRPLLHISKAELIDYLKDTPYLQDPSNLNEQFTRVRIRKELQILSTEALHERLDTHQKRQCQRIAEEKESWLFLADHAVLSPWGYASLQAPSTAPLRTIALLLQYVSGKLYAPNQDALQRLVSNLLSNPSKAFTMHTCTVWCKDGQWYFVRESRHSLHTELRSSKYFYWDHRFLVGFITKKHLYLTLELGILGREGRRQVCHRYPEYASTHWRILESLPAYWSKGVLMGVPHLGINLAPHTDTKSFPGLRFVPHYDILKFEPTERK